MPKLLLIIQREFLSRIRKRSYLIMSVMGPILIGIFAYVAMSVYDQERQHKVIVVDPHGIFLDGLKDTPYAKFSYTKEDMSDAQFKESGYEVLVYINRKVATNNAVDVFYKENPNAFLKADIAKSLEYELEKIKIELYDIDPVAYARIKNGVTIKDHRLDGKTIARYSQKGSIGFFYATVICFFIIQFGGMLIRGVSEEKNSRIVEVLISSAKPFELMMGKILGIASAALIQSLVWMMAGFAFVGYIRNSYFPSIGDTQQVVESLNGAEPVKFNYMAELIEASLGYMLPYFMFFLLFGFLFYAAIYAAVGAKGDSESESQNYAFPITLILLLSLFISLMAIENPNGDLANLAAYIPFSSSLVMMVKLAIGEGTSASAPMISGSILIVSFLLTVWLTSRIYARSILKR